MTTIYHAPDRFGMQLVASHDAAFVHAFDIIALWRNQDGQYYAGHDHGCECTDAAPFEHLSAEDLTPVQNMADVAAFAGGAWHYFYRWNQSGADPTEGPVADLMSKVAIVLDHEVGGPA